MARILHGESGAVEKGELTDADEKGDMEWGTCMVFSCVSDCCRMKDDQGKWGEVKAGWKEEIVFVQWDT